MLRVRTEVRILRTRTENPSVLAVVNKCMTRPRISDLLMKHAMHSDVCDNC